MRFVFIGLLLLLVTLPTMAQTPNWDFLKQGVVRIQTGPEGHEQTGTGFVFSISPGTIRVLTARHVLRDPEGGYTSTAKVYFSSDPITAVPAQALGPRSDRLDLAVLELHPGPTAHLPKNFPKLQWVSNEALQQGEPVWTMDGEWNVVPNTITRLDSEADTEKFRYTATSVGTGYSGGPVFSSGGFLIGMHDAATGGVDGSPNYSVAIKIASAFATLDALGYSVETTLGTATPVRGGATPTPSPGPTRTAVATEKPKLWKDIQNSHTYSFQAAGDRLYIRENNNVVADLVMTKDKKGGQFYAGHGSISNCPAGAGYVQLDVVSADRIEGRVEQAVNANGKTSCGGFFGRMRSMISVVWLPE